MTKCRNLLQQQSYQPQTLHATTWRSGKQRTPECSSSPGLPSNRDENCKAQGRAMRKQRAESPEPVRRLQRLTHTLARMRRTPKELTLRS